MLLEYLEPLLRPLRELRNRIVGIKTTKGNALGEVRHVRSLGNAGVQEALRAKDSVGQGLGKAKDAAGKATGAADKAKARASQLGQATGRGAGAKGAGMSPSTTLRPIGSWFWRKMECSSCGARYTKDTVSCPACDRPSAKTQAFAIDAGGGGGSTQLLGWLVPVQGPQRGSLFALTPKTIVGTDADCDVVLTDKFMSGRHAEIKVEGGTWVVCDLGSTNGTYVNDKRVERQELIDNDFVKFGSSLAKFKSL